jgi:hypothetical protein
MFLVPGSRHEPGTRNSELGTGSVLILLACLSASCGAAPAREQPQEQAVWNTIRSWSGNGDAQLDSFTSDTGALRIEWEARAENEATAPGIFRVAVHSSISGRPLTVPIDHRCPGRGTAFVSEEPRVFFALVSAQDLDWKITISERLR